MAYRYGDLITGDKITDETLQRMSDYKGKIITQSDRAKVAMEFRNKNNKENQIVDFMCSLSKESGVNDQYKIVTQVMFYNATGDDIVYSGHNNWSGFLEMGSHAPQVLGNGQWGCFLHKGNFNSVGALVYTGSYTDNSAQKMDWMFAWSNNLRDPHDRKKFVNTITFTARELGQLLKGNSKSLTDLAVVTNVRDVCVLLILLTRSTIILHLKSYSLDMALLK
ncbi:hypothetical protein ACFE04_002729 [Oxalis oulophora]